MYLDYNYTNVVHCSFANSYIEKINAGEWQYIVYLRGLEDEGKNVAA